MKKMKPAADPDAYVSALEVREGMSVDGATVHRLAREALGLNIKLGNPTQEAQ